MGAGKLHPTINISKPIKPLWAEAPVSLLGDAEGTPLQEYASGQAQPTVMLHIQTLHLAEVTSDAKSQGEATADTSSRTTQQSQPRSKNSRPLEGSEETQVRKTKARPSADTAQPSPP